MGFVPVMEGLFNMKKSINVIHWLNEMKREKEHIISSNNIKK